MGMPEKMIHATLGTKRIRCWHGGMRYRAIVRCRYKRYLRKRGIPSFLFRDMEDTAALRALCVLASKA